VGADGSPPPKEPGSERVINSGRLTLEQKDDAGDLLWVVHGKSSTTISQEGGETISELQGVTGEIYEKSVIVSRFSSDKGVASDKDKAIQLDGRVTIISEKDKATLTAATVKWDDQQKLYDARGDVRIKSQTYEAKAERLLANSTLKKIGTPDLFKK